MNLTITTLQLAICSVQSEIKKYELMTQDETATDEDLDEFGHYVLDLSRALNELGLAYDQERQPYPDFPAFELLMRKLNERESTGQATNVQDSQ